MKKSEFIKKYGEKEYNRQLELNRSRSIIWYSEHRDEQIQCHLDYYDTKEGRANHISNNNNHSDRIKNFDVSDNVNADWIINNVFSGQTCIYCGEDDWKKLGVDRIDNTKPHTPDNLVPCCRKCNCSRKHIRTVEEQIEYTKNKSNGK